jgi:hypothetical protein
MTLTKKSKFLICNDLTASNQESSDFILHNHKPRFLAKVTEIAFEEITTIPERPFADTLYVNPEGVMEVYRIEVSDFYDRSDDEALQDELFEASGYYAKYLQVIEEGEGMEPGFPVKDFSEELPGLKILRSQESWTIVYNGLVAEFPSEEEMDEFLENELEIEPELLDQGIINQFD